MSVHNGEEFLAEAMQSILDQTYTSFEFLVVDDGSTDRTPAILDGFVDARVKRLRNPVRRGVGYSVGWALAAAQGKFIARMDADDVSYPQRLQRSMELFERFPHVGLVAGSADRLFMEDGRILKNYYASTYAIPPLDDIEAHCRYVKERLDVENIVCQPTVLMPRRTLEVIGSYRLPLVEDYDLWLRIAERLPIIIAPEPWLLHRVHGAATSRRRWLAMKRHYWIVRQARTLRRAGRKERLAALRLLSLPVNPVGMWILADSASEELRILGRFSRDQGHGARAALLTASGISLRALTHPGLALKSLWRRIGIRSAKVPS